MSRPLRLVVCIALACLAPVLPARAEHPAIQLAHKLQETVDFSGYDDPKMTLLDALDNLHAQYKLQFTVNEAAFRAEQVPDVLSSTIASKAVPKMTGLRLSTVLKKIFERIETQSGATYVLRKDGVEITTNADVTREFYRRRADEGPEDVAGGRALPPLVQTEFSKRPLDEALKELAAATDFNIVLDVRAGEQARDPGKTLVTATLINVPLDTAVRILADMAGMKPVQMDNVLYVTNKENAEALQAEDAPKPMPGGLVPGAGIGGLGAFGMQTAGFLGRR